jgi:hypothetical protein
MAGTRSGARVSLAAEGSANVATGLPVLDHLVGELARALREPAREAALQRQLQRRFDAGLDEFKWFIYRFTSPTMKHLFANPRNVWRVEEAVVSMLAGDVFDARPVLRRLRVFRAIYALTALAMAPRAWRAWRNRRSQIAVEVQGETLQGD